MSDTDYRQLSDDYSEYGVNYAPQQLEMDQISLTSSNQSIDPTNQPPPTDKDIAPKDVKNILFLSLFIIGLATFFPSTAILASNDFYTVIWGDKGKQLIFLAPILVQALVPFVQTLLTKYQERLTYTSRIEFAFILNSIIAIVFAFQANYLPEVLSFLVACVSILVVGANNAMLKCTELSLVSMYPSTYTQVLLVGQAASPCAVLILKLILKKIYTLDATASKEETDAAAKSVALIFFIVSALFTSLAAITYRVARKSTFSKYYFPNFRTRYAKYLEEKRQYQQYKEEQAKLQQTSGDLVVISQHDHSAEKSAIFIDPHCEDPANPQQLSKTDHLEHQIATMPVKIRKMDVLFKMKYFVFMLAVSTVPPCAVYPSLLSVMRPVFPFEISDVYHHLLMMCVYCFTDILSRAIPLSIINRICSLKSTYTVWAWIAARYVIYFFLVLVTYLKADVSSFFHILLTILTASSQAVVLVAILTNYKEQSKLSLAEANVAGSFSAIGIGCGVLAGYLLALALNSIIEAIW